MKKEDLHRELDLFLIFAIFFIIIFIFIYPTITGLIVYSSATYNFTFENPNDYTYDSNLILIENNEAKLKLQESTYTWTTINISEIYVATAYYNGNDKTEKIIDLDDKKQLVEKEKTFDITFQENLQNNDILSLYINEEKKSLVYLCDLSTFCEENYGSVYFPNDAGWYNITIQNLQSQINTLSILTNNSIKVNYIKIIRETEQLNSETNYSYPETSSLQTNNVNLPTINQNLLFSKEENLNQQEIKYYYSNDDGATWTDLQENLSSLEKIKIKAEFKSNSSETPVLYNMSISYEFCEESWNCTDWSECYENETKTRACIDINECGTLDYKPTETQSCIYTPPCEENWTCTEWSSCINENQTRACNDFNFCNTTINKPEEIQNCTIQETVTTSSGGGGGGSSSSSTFTRPVETTGKETVSEETKPVETSTTKEETPTKTEAPKIEQTKQETPLQKFTGFIAYNVGKEGVSIISLSIFILICTFLFKKYKKVILKKLKI